MADRLYSTAELWATSRRARRGCDRAQRLVSVNGVRLGTDEGVLVEHTRRVGRGIESYVEVTVWLGPTMATLTVHPGAEVEVLP